MSKRLKCPKCLKVFKEKWRYENHLKNVECDKIYTCEKCGITYKRKDHLASHNKSNPECAGNVNSERRFACDCGKDFSSSSNLARHKHTCNNSNGSKMTQMMEMMKKLQDKLDKLEGKGDTYIFHKHY
jgi:uncharacterized Zn-finger protein